MADVDGIKIALYIFVLFAGIGLVCNLLKTDFGRVILFFLLFSAIGKITDWGGMLTVVVTVTVFIFLLWLYLLIDQRDKRNIPKDPSASNTEQSKPLQNYLEQIRAANHASSMRQSRISRAETERSCATMEYSKNKKGNATKIQEKKEPKSTPLQKHIGAYFGHDALRQCAGVYVISRCDEGVVKVKVGMTKDFSRRFPQIKSHCRTAGIPEIMPEILVPISVGRADVESAVLEQLSAHWESGEWFRMPVEDAINAVLTTALQHRLGKLESRRYIKPWEKGRR